jgi:outer membrane protein
VAAVCGAALLAPGLAASETLADAVALAYQSNPTLQAQRAQLRALDESYVQARQGYRPTADASGSVSYQNISGPLDQETNSAGATLSATQPLYTGGRVTNAVNAAEADILSGREQLRQIEASVLLSVIQAYVDVRRDFQSLGIRQENVAVLRRQLEESRARFEVGEITRTDVAQSEARLAAAQSLLASAQAQLAISRSNYAAVVGQNPGDLEPEPTLILPATLDEAFDTAQQVNPAIRSAAFSEQASRSRVAAARADLGPTVGLRTQLGYSGALDPLDRRDFSRQFSASAVVSQPLYAGGLRRSRIPAGDRAEQRRPNRHRGRPAGRAADRVAVLEPAAGQPGQHPQQRGAGAGRRGSRRRACGKKPPSACAPPSRC